MPDGIDVEGVVVVPYGIDVDEDVAVPGDVLVDAAVDGEVWAYVEPLAEDVDVSDVVAQAVPATARMADAAAVASCLDRAFIGDPFERKGRRRARPSIATRPMQSPCPTARR